MCQLDETNCSTQLFVVFHFLVTRVILFSKLAEMFLGYYDPVNTIFYNELEKLPGDLTDGSLEQLHCDSPRNVTFLHHTNMKL